MFMPTAPVGTASSDTGKCTATTGVVYLSSYVSGGQLQDQGFAAPMGKVYYQGPNLRLSKIDGNRGEQCSSTNTAMESIPSMATGIIAWGASETDDSTSALYYDAYLKTSRSESIGCGCKIKVNIESVPVTNFSFEFEKDLPTSKIDNKIAVSIEGVCRSECSGLKVYSTPNWCSKPTADLGRCMKGGLIGANAFVYFEGLDASSGAASTVDDFDFAPAKGPASSSFPATGPAPSKPTSAAVKATSSFSEGVLFMFALFAVVGLA